MFWQKNSQNSAADQVKWYCPYLLNVVLVQSEGEFLQHCTTTLIDDDSVLMAGHCFGMRQIDRDDLRDGGASHFVACIDQIRAHSPKIKVEIHDDGLAVVSPSRCARHLSVRIKKYV